MTNAILFSYTTIRSHRCTFFIEILVHQNFQIEFKAPTTLLC